MGRLLRGQVPSAHPLILKQNLQGWDRESACITGSPHELTFCLNVKYGLMTINPNYSVVYCRVGIFKRLMR